MVCVLPTDRASAVSRGGTDPIPHPAVTRKHMFFSIECRFSVLGTECSGLVQEQDRAGAVEDAPWIGHGFFQNIAIASADVSQRWPSHGAEHKRIHVFGLSIKGCRSSTQILFPRRLSGEKRSS